MWRPLRKMSPDCGVLSQLFLLLLFIKQIRAANCQGTGLPEGGDILRTSPHIAEKLRQFRGGSDGSRASRLTASERTSDRERTGKSGNGDGDKRTIVSFCPQKCSCNITISNQLQVICDEVFQNDFPIETLRKDVEILKIVPRCRDDAGSHVGYSLAKKRLVDTCHNRVPNRLTLGPNFQYLRLLKVLVITDSNIPNIGIRTLWGLSGLRILDLSRNSLTNIMDKNFDGLYSLKEIHFNDNNIRSMVSAAFRHVTQLETLSLKNNQITGESPIILGETLAADGADIYKVSEGKTRFPNANPRPHSEKLSLRDNPSVL